MAAQQAVAARVSRSEDALPPVYSTLFHPEKTCIDIFLDILMSLFLPFKKIHKLPPSADEETCSYNKLLREKLDKMQQSAIRASVFDYVKKSGNEMVESELKLPRRPDLLKESGLSTESCENVLPLDDLSVLLFFPEHLATAGLVPSDYTKNQRGCIVVDNFDIKTVSEDVPIIVFFHGGGLTLGNALDVSGYKLFTDMLMDVESKVPGSNARAILASVDYSLAPDHPFPAAVVDAMTAVTHFLEAHPDRHIHIAGVSAGGNLSAVASLECFRRYPGRIRSSTSLCPMMDPAADSVSYYQNSTSAKLCAAEWVRWCWRAYLQLPSVQVDEQEEEESELERALGHGSNRYAWRQSKWKGTDMERLIRPIADLPPSLNDHSLAPRFLVSTNRGDALMTEGVDYFSLLKEAGANVRWLDCGGSHLTGTLIERETYRFLVEAWGNAIFGDSSTN